MNKTIINTLIISTLTLFSCKKEGSTDLDAVNYDAEAKKDNASCTYESTSTGWNERGC